MTLGYFFTTRISKWNNESGTHFDPDIIEALKESKMDFKRIKATYGNG